VTTSTSLLGCLCSSMAPVFLFTLLPLVSFGIQMLRYMILRIIIVAFKIPYLFVPSLDTLWLWCVYIKLVINLLLNTLYALVCLDRISYTVGIDYACSLLLWYITLFWHGSVKLVPWSITKMLSMLCFFIMSWFVISELLHACTAWSYTCFWTVF
jgi:hypothetical protein